MFKKAAATVSCSKVFKHVHFGAYAVYYTHHALSTELLSAVVAVVLLVCVAVEHLVAHK